MGHCLKQRDTTDVHVFLIPINFVCDESKQINVGSPCDNLSNVSTTFKPQLYAHGCILCFCCYDVKAEDYYNVIIVPTVITVTTQFQRRTPLMIASEKGHSVIVKILIDAGADLEATDVVNTLFLQ